MPNPKEGVVTKQARSSQLSQIGTPDSWGIQGVKLSLGEISTSAAIAKHSGSIFSRVENCRLLDTIETGFDIHIHGLPGWLSSIQMARSVTILAAQMRRIKVPRTMEELNMYRLSGLATFVVLCCRYTEDEGSIINMLDQLMVGRLGTVVKIEDDHKPIPYTMKGHLGAFVRSCLDADRDSDVSQQAQKWMAELHDFGKLGKFFKSVFQRNREESVDLVGELLGGTNLEEDLAKRRGEQNWRTPETKHPEDFAKVHNTLHLTSAYIALAAAAHGASVVVECISEGGTKTFPKEPRFERRNSTFLLRLWLTQPPENVRGILRYSKKPNQADNDSSSRNSAYQTGDEDVTVVGGTLELATWVAKKLDFQCQSTIKPEPEALLDLWLRGAAYGKSLRWAVKKRLTTNTFGSLTLVLKSPGESPNIPAEALPLCKMLLERDKDVRGLTRPVANIVHDLYRLTDYTTIMKDQPENESSEIVNAMLFVIVSIAVETLRNIMNPAGDTTELYAMNLATLNSGTRAFGNLHNLIRSATNLSDGVAPYRLVFTAATVWGGAQFTSTSRPGYQKPVEHLLGIVAPHCTVMFDILREPLLLVSKGRIEGLLSIWRGPVPMLPRDPITDCMYSGYDERWGQSEVWPEYNPQISLSDDQDYGPLLWTFEPFDHEATRGVFCFWLHGQLVAEFAPHSILVSILSGSEEVYEQPMTKNDIQAIGRAPKSFVYLSKSDLLKLTGFLVRGKICVVINGLGDAVWSMFALCCAAGPSDSSHHLLTYIHRGELDGFDIEDFRPKMVEGQALVLIP